MNTIVQYSDAGHSWFKVKKSLLHKLGIANKITEYSYQLNEYAYLEEDCDMSTFLEAYFKGNIPDQWWNILKVKNYYSNKQSKIRNYSTYKSHLPIIPEIGLNVKLYGNNYTIVDKFNSKWIIQNELGNQYYLKSNQIGELEVIK